MCHKRLCLRLAHVFIHRRRMRSFSAYVRTHPHSFHVTYVPRYTDDRYATRWSSTSECINCRCMNGIARLACMQTAPPSLKSLYALATVHEPRHHARKASGTYVWRIDSLQRKRIVAPPVILYSAEAPRHSSLRSCTGSPMNDKHEAALHRLEHALTSIPAAEELASMQPTLLNIKRALDAGRAVSLAPSSGRPRGLPLWMVVRAPT